MTHPRFLGVIAFGYSLDSGRFPRLGVVGGLLLGAAGRSRPTMESRSCNVSMPHSRWPRDAGRCHRAD